MKEKENLKNKKDVKKIEKEKLSEYDIKELMHHSSYKRKRGVIKQVK